MKDLLVFSSVVLAGLLVWFAMHYPRTPRFRKKSVVTGPELELFHRLQDALPDCVVSPQVAVSALIEPAGLGRARRFGLECIAGRRVGFAVFGKDMRVLAVVELDHRSRPARDDRRRDAWFAGAGIHTVRFSARQMPSSGAIRRAIFPRKARTQAHASGASDAGIEFVRPETPWRNTVNAHI